MSKLSLLQAKGESYFISGRLSIGVYVKNGQAILIDSGIDKDTSKHAHAAIREAGLNVIAIINTHHHADHCGGNNFFQSLSVDTRIYATVFEKYFIETPELQPICFCSGAAPFAELCTKYLQAPPSRVTNTIEPYVDQIIDIAGEQFSIVTLPGHTAGSIGIITPDNVLYVGDAIFGEETFNKHGMLFYTNISDTLASFKKLKQLAIAGCVLYHGGFVEDIHGLVELHEKRIIETKEMIYELIKSDPISIELLTQKIMQSLTIPDNIMQFALTKTCVNAYVTELQKNERVVIEMKNGLLQVKIR